jgi:hypothetical protein
MSCFLYKYLILLYLHRGSSFFLSLSHAKAVWHSYDTFRPLVRERTVPTKRPPLVGEVNADFCGCGQHDGSLRPYSRISRLRPLLFPSSSSSVVLARLSEPRSRPTTSQKIS